MTVKELIEALQKMPPDAEIFCLDTDGDEYPFEWSEPPRPRLDGDGRVLL